MSTTEGAFAISFSDGVVDALDAALDAIGKGWIVELSLDDDSAEDIAFTRYEGNEVCGFLFDKEAGKVTDHAVSFDLTGIRRIHIY